MANVEVVKAVVQAGAEAIAGAPIPEAFEGLRELDLAGLHRQLGEAAVGLGEQALEAVQQQADTVGKKAKEGDGLLRSAATGSGSPTLLSAVAAASTFETKGATFASITATMSRKAHGIGQLLQLVAAHIGEMERLQAAALALEPDLSGAQAEAVDKASQYVAELQ